MTQRAIDLMLSELGNAMGMENLAFDDSGGCILQFDETMNVLLLYEGGRDVLYLFSFVGELQAGKEALMMRRLLEANYRWEESGGGTLSLRKEENNVVLTHCLDVGTLTREILEQQLSGFVTALERWMSYLKDSSTDSASTADDDDVPSAQMIRA